MPSPLSVFGLVCGPPIVREIARSRWVFAEPAVGDRKHFQRLAVAHPLSRRSSERYWIASETCAVSMVSEPARSATVRAILSTDS